MTRRDLDARTPLVLDDPAAVWRIAAGHVDLFAAAVDGGRVVGRRSPVATLHVGDVIAGILPAGDVALVAVGIEGTALDLIGETDEAAPAAGRIARALRTQHLCGGDAAAAEPWSDLRAAEHAVLAELAHRIATADDDAREAIGQRVAVDAQDRTAAFVALARTLEPLPVDAADDGSPLAAALRLVAEAAGAEWVEPTPSALRAGRISTLGDASNVRVRRVVLDGSWWRDDAGPLLALRVDDGAPVALLPRRGGRYDLVDPAAGTRQRVDAASAATLQPDAWMPYRPLPDRPLRGRDLVRYAWHDARGDVTTLAAAGLMLGLLSIVPAIVVQRIFGTAVPMANGSLVLGFVALLIGVAIASALLAVAQGFALLRTESRASTGLQAAVWDRLLRLPVPFFRGFKAGDLAQRADGIEAIRVLVTSSVLITALTTVFSLVNIAYLFTIEPAASLGALGVVTAAFLITGVAIRYQLPHQRRIQESQGRLGSLAFQMLSGIAKLRVAGAESRGYAQWAREFATLKHAFYRSQLAFVVLAVISATLPAVASIVVFAIILAVDSGIGAAAFLAFSTSFGTVITSFIGLLTTATTLVAVVPLYERALSILQAQPETVGDGIDPGQLAGRIDIESVTMAYGPGLPHVLHDVSLTVQPGEFVAVVGPSGAGKSSLLRALLGFEQLEKGIVAYDGTDLRALDLGVVRRQIGTVVQNGKLLPGTILHNIIGTKHLTHEDAWQAARWAGLEADVRAMPLGLQTFISEGASTISGGQRQRILIARALVGRPRIVFLDEATSALDNVTQNVVSAALDELDATRLVIAHRLSTVRRADRIVVLDAGRIVESGTYDELVAGGGLFTRLVERQEIG